MHSSTNFLHLSLIHFPKLNKDTVVRAAQPVRFGIFVYQWLGIAMLLLDFEYISNSTKSLIRKMQVFRAPQHKHTNIRSICSLEVVLDSSEKIISALEATMNNAFCSLLLARSSTQSWKCWPGFFSCLNFSTVIWQGATALELLQQDEDVPCLPATQAARSASNLQNSVLRSWARFQDSIIIFKVVCSMNCRLGSFSWKMEESRRLLNKKHDNWITCIFVHICTLCLQQAAVILKIKETSPFLRRKCLKI